MEAGYDYLLLRGRAQRRLFHVSGIFIFVLGAMLLASSGAYYGYSAKAHADLDNLNASLPGPVPSTGVIGSAVGITDEVNSGRAHVAPLAAIPPESTAGGMDTEYLGDPYLEIPVDESGQALTTTASKEVATTGGIPAGIGVGVLIVTPGEDAGTTAQPSNNSVAAVGTASPIRTLPASAIGSQQLFPGESLLANFWSNPLSYESASYREQRLLQGFAEVEAGHGLSVGTGSAATRLIVPSIAIDSRVTELAILYLGGSRAYETPDKTVGHIPETANSGEGGSAWFFGHTESPMLGEGSVFFNLSKIPAKLQAGEDVFVITENGEGRYLYRITSSRVMPQEEMRLYETGQATIHLVSCVPRLVYDHRLIVSGELIGIQ